MIKNIDGIAVSLAVLLAFSFIGYSFFYNPISNVKYEKNVCDFFCNKFGYDFKHVSGGVCHCTQCVPFEMTNTTTNATTRYKACYDYGFDIEKTSMVMNNG